jgi:hypothetical protein
VQQSTAQQPLVQQPAAQLYQAKTPHAQSSSVQMIYSIPRRSSYRKLNTASKEDMASLNIREIAQDKMALIRMRVDQYSQACNQNLILMKRLPANSVVNPAASTAQMQSDNSGVLASGSARPRSYSSPGHEESSGEVATPEIFHEMQDINVARIADSIYPIIVRRIRTDMERRGYCSRA